MVSLSHAPWMHAVTLVTVLENSMKARISLHHSTQIACCPRTNSTCAIHTAQARLRPARTCPQLILLRRFFFVVRQRQTKIGAAPPSRDCAYPIHRPSSNHVGFNDYGALTKTTVAHFARERHGKVKRWLMLLNAAGSLVVYRIRRTGEPKSYRYRVDISSVLLMRLTVRKRPYPGRHGGGKSAAFGVAALGGE